jgi:hypothetical protein
MYKETLISCKAKLNEDKTNCDLDIPFPVFHREVVHKDKKYGPYPLPKELDGQTVLALITYSTQERRVRLPDGTEIISVPNSTKDVAKFLGVISSFQTDARVTENWTLTKEDALATSVSTTDKDGKEQIITTKYDGADKLDKAGFYPSECFEKAAEEIVRR